MEILPTHGGERPAFDVLVDRLRAGAVVPLLADRDLSARGVEVDFFGGRTRMPAGPALLALRTGAPLYVASMWYEPDAACASIDGPLPLPGRRQRPAGPAGPGADPADRRRSGGGHRPASGRLAHAAADVAGPARHGDGAPDVAAPPAAPGSV